MVRLWHVFDDEFMDTLLFGALPYVAVATLLLVLAARRFRVPPFAIPPPPRPLSEGPWQYRERFLLRVGLLVIVAGHLLAFLIPEQVLLWNNDSLRRYVLEVSALTFALMTLVGLLMTVARCLFGADARQSVGLFDWLLYALLLVLVSSGIGLALVYPWGSSWYASLVVPYLRSLVRLDPDLTLIRGLPHLFKLHLLTACVLVLVLPLTRAVRPLIAPGWDEEQERAPSLATAAVLLLATAFSLLALVPRLWGTHLPGNHEGYEPVQPIAFSHRLHAGELQVACIYCHSGAEMGHHAGVAAASVCMNCHRFVTAPSRDVLAERELAAEEKRPARTLISPELAKLYAALALNDKMQPDAARKPTPLHWVRVHRLPSFVRFDHGSHVNAGVACQHCHGPVESMERVRQVEDLSMGWCVRCHRDPSPALSTLSQSPGGGLTAAHVVHPSNDCSTCHH